MKKINPKCLNHASFLCSIIILYYYTLHYYDLFPHPERFSEIKRYISNYEICSNSPECFEYCNPSISLTVYNENGKIIYTPTNNTNKKAHLVKINNYRYNAIKPRLSKEIKLKNSLSQFTPKELSRVFNDMIIQKIHTTQLNQYITFYFRYEESFLFSSFLHYHIQVKILMIYSYH